MSSESEGAPRRRLLIHSSHPPASPLSPPNPSMFECRIIHTHTHSHQMLVRVVPVSQSCALSLGQLLYCLGRCWGRHVLSGWRDCRGLARLWRAAAEGFLTECEIGGCLFLPPAVYTQPEDTENTDLTYTHLKEWWSPVMGQ